MSTTWHCSWVLLKKDILSKIGSKKKNGGWLRKAATSAPATSTTPDKKFQAQTPGFEDRLYVLGKPDSAVSFIAVTDDLSTYFVGHVPRNGAKLARCMTSLTRPDHPEPAKPVREHRDAKGVNAEERTTLSKKTIAGLTITDSVTA